jgi:hypothetical protein
MQLLVAVAFVSIPVVRHRYGPAAKAAAVAELRRQNVRPEVLEENKLRFDAGGHETAAPATVAAITTGTAALNFAVAGLAPLMTWIFSSLVLLMNAPDLHPQHGGLRRLRHRPGRGLLRLTTPPDEQGFRTDAVAVNGRAVSERGAPLLPSLDKQRARDRLDVFL